MWRQKEPGTSLTVKSISDEASRGTDSARHAIKRQRRFIFGGLLLLAGLAYLTLTVTRASAVYYLTVSELYAKGGAAAERPVRVSAIVDAGSIQRDSATFETRFTASDEGGRLPVVYHGTVPDIFQPGIQVVVEGKLRPDGVFAADSLLTKCPAHFQAATPSSPAGH
jgi:cytochrome c-type biogenesis protein CcmE